MKWLIETFIRYKVYHQRSSTYVNLVMAFLTFSIYTKVYDLSLWQVIIGTLVFIILYFAWGKFDYKYGLFEKEQTLWNNKNKEIQEILSILKKK